MSVLFPVPSRVTATSQSRPLKRAPRCSAHLPPPVSLDGCGRAKPEGTRLEVARGRCGAGEEGASLGGERREEAPGRSRGCQLRPSRASALRRPAGSQRGEGVRATSAASARRSVRLGVHSAAAARHPGRCVELSVRPRRPRQPLLTPLPPPLREHLSPAAAAGGGREEEEEGSRRGLVWPPRPARPAPARTPSPASYFRTRKVRAAPGDSAAAPVPGSRVRSRVARRTVQTPPWLRPPPAPGSPTSISSSRSSESKRPCLASPPRDPSSPSWGQGARGAEAG